MGKNKRTATDGVCDIIEDSLMELLKVCLHLSTASTVTDQFVPHVPGIKQMIILRHLPYCDVHKKTLLQK